MNADDRPKRMWCNGCGKISAVRLESPKLIVSKFVRCLRCGHKWTTFTYKTDDGRLVPYDTLDTVGPSDPSDLPIGTEMGYHDGDRHGRATVVAHKNGFAVLAVEWRGDVPPGR